MNNMTVIGSLLLFSVGAIAETAPKMETFLGYQFTRFNSATNIPAFSQNGAGGQFVYNINNWFGAVADIGATHNGNIHNVNIDNTMANFLFGPRVAIRKWSRVTPYFQVLWGGVYYAGSTPVQVPADQLPAIPTPFGDTRTAPFVTLRASTSQTVFAMTAGGGLDIKLTKHITLRPIGLDYFMTRLQNLRTAGDNNQNNLRVTAGVNFTFGGPQ